MLLRPSATEDEGNARIPIRAVTPADLDASLGLLGAAGATFARACGFKAEPGQVLLVPGADGGLACVLFGVAPADARSRDEFLAGKLATSLPAGEYRLADQFPDPRNASLAFGLASYRFARFREVKAAQPKLEAPKNVDADLLDIITGAVASGRDLINRPANDLGPEALEAEARTLARKHGAACVSIVGDNLLTENLPMIHAVGRAASEAPRLVDLAWGDKTAPKVTLVGKGVCFDTGGLDIKPDTAMLLMKKDMGGAANALALADMIMAANVAVRLRVLLPIVENAIAGNAFRPGDVLKSRKGLTVEIGNTDAEGRLILADALALADEDPPDLLFDFATLTGAARVALGPDLPPFYTMDDDLAAEIARQGRQSSDPVWRMPLWDPYDDLLKGKIADLNNISGGPFAGSITAALFLRRFVERTKSWAHFDVYGWNPTTKPGRPEGGEIQTARALFDLLLGRYGARARDHDA